MRPVTFLTIVVILYCNVWFSGSVTPTAPVNPLRQVSLTERTGSRITGNRKPVDKRNDAVALPKSSKAFGRAKVRSSVSTNAGPVTPKPEPDTQKSWFQLRSDTVPPHQQTADDLRRSDAVQTAVYTNTAGFLMLGMRKWLDGPLDLRTIEPYLGYDPKTVSLINVGMTQLMGQHLAGNVFAMDLLDTFYYACDVRNLDEYRSGNVGRVKNAFESFLLKHSWMNDTVRVLTEKELFDNLTEALKRKIQTVRTKFSVTVPLMKNTMLVEPTDDDVIKRLKDQLVYEKKPLLSLMSRPKNTTLFDVAESFAKIANGKQVNLNHLSILALLIPHMFRYAYDVVQLFLELHRHEIDDGKLKNILSFSTFVVRFKSLFVERYFEFKGKSDQRLMNDLDTLIEFFDPNTEEDRSVYNLSNCNNFKKNTKDADSYRRNTADMINRVFDNLMNSFKCDDNVKNAIRDPRRTHSTASYMLYSIIATNIQEGLHIMDKFSSNFIDDSVLVNLSLK